MDLAAASPDLTGSVEGVFMSDAELWMLIGLSRRCSSGVSPHRRFSRSQNRPSPDATATAPRSLIRRLASRAPLRGANASQASAATL